LAQAQQEDDPQPDAPEEENWATLDECSAMDPETWPTLITSNADVLTLQLLLRTIFPPNPAPHAKKDNATTTDCIEIAVKIAKAMGIMAATGTADAAALDCLAKAATSTLKRALIIKFLAQGHASQYVEQFSLAVEGQIAPPWIRNAQALATHAVKAATAAPFQHRGRGGRGGERGGRGNGGGSGNFRGKGGKGSE
jgi:hypothetical protein